MASNQELTARVTGNSGQLRAKSPQDAAAGVAMQVIGSMNNLISKVMPAAGQDVRFKAALVSIYRATPGLAKCDVDSQKLAILKAAAVGLELGDEVFLIPRKNTKTNQIEANCQIGYQGWLQLLRRSGLITSASAFPVREGEAFDIDYGAGTVTHKPQLRGEPGSIFGFYAQIKLTNGERLVYYMSAEEMNAHMAQYGAETPAWKSSPVAMACKTVLLKCKRFAPRSRDMALGERAESDRPVSFNAATGELEHMAVPDVPVESEIVDESPAPSPAPPDPADLPNLDEHGPPPRRQKPATREPGVD